MEKTNEKALNDFLGSEEPKTNPPIDPDNKSSILDEREGLIERVDKVLVTRDGKQLLREQY
jgi:hypothetical protein